MRKTFWNRLDRLFTPRRAALLCAVLLGLSLAPLAAISLYNHPCSDDYNYGLYVSQAVGAGGSLWDVLSAAAREVRETYFDWQGTFSAVFLMALQPAAFGERFYMVTPYLMVGSLLFSTFFFLKEVFVRRLSMSRPAWVTVSCALGFFMVHFSPNAFEGFFWYNGSVFYTFFFAWFLCALTFVLKFLRASSPGRAAACAVAAGVFSFFLGGGNYPTALLGCVLLLGSFAWCLWKRRPLAQKAGTLCFFLLEGAAFAISILAPGNSVRQSYFESRPGAVKSIVLALASGVRYSGEWLTLPLLLALALLCPLFCRCAEKLAFRFPLPGLAPIAALCLLGVLLTPAIYAMGNTGAGRMEAMYYNAFCLLAAGVAFYFCGWAAHRASLAEASKRAGRAGARLALPLAAAFAVTVVCLAEFKSLTGVSAGLSLLRGEAQAYHAQVEEQLAILEDPAVTDAVLEPITYRPELLMPWAVPQLSDDPEATANQRVAAFYGKNSVVVKDPS